MTDRTLSHPWGTQDPRDEEDWSREEHYPPCPDAARCVKCGAGEACQACADCGTCGLVDCAYCRDPGREEDCHD
jgi:hypothetical protein